MEEVLKIENLSLKIKNKYILKNIDFSVKKGEIVGLIGINGSGKTTLLKCLNKLNEISNGNIYIMGKDINSLTSIEIAKEVAFMSQNTIVNLSFNCLDVVVMGRYPYLNGKDFSKDDYIKAREYMKLTNTLKFEKNKINKLSGGERQKVLFTKILSQESKIFLLDEPTSSMDFFNQEQIFKMCKMGIKNDKTIIISIHDLHIAARYCDRLLLLKDGEKIAFGSVEEVLTKKNIKIGFGINIETYINPISKMLDYCIC